MNTNPIQIAKANTIIQQLGGNSFCRMTGAKQFVVLASGVSFRIPATMTKNRINAVQITLTPEDDYTVNFYAIHGTKIKQVSSHEGIYCDQLAELFRDETGLETRMPRFV